MKHIYIFVLALFPAFAVLGQGNGSIQGAIKTSDGNPAEYVNILIETTSRGAVADRNGHFEITTVRDIQIMIQK